MKPTFRLDTTGLQREVRALLATTSRSLPVVINQTALNAIGRALNYTPRADKDDIMADIAQVISVDKVLKKGANRGKIRKVKALGVVRQVQTKSGKLVPLAALIINKKRAARGLKGLYGRDMQAAILAMVRARLRSVGFLASGWVPGIRDLASALTGLGARPFILARLKETPVYGKRKGHATPARTGFKSVAQVLNNVKGIDKVGGPALQRGIDEEQRDIARHIAEKMNPAFAQFNRNNRR